VWRYWSTPEKRVVLVCDAGGRPTSASRRDAAFVATRVATTGAPTIRESTTVNCPDTAYSEYEHTLDTDVGSKRDDRTTGNRTGPSVDG
jgi:hypothetical protein